MIPRQQVAAAAFLVLLHRATAWHGGVPAMRGWSPLLGRTAAAARPSQAKGEKIRHHEGTNVRRHRRLRIYPEAWWAGGQREISLRRRFCSSTSDTVEQEPAPGNDATTNKEPSTSDEKIRPFAKVGDVVQYTGKWKDELVFGEIRQLQQVDQTGEWRAYVLGLDQIGEGQYARKKNRKSKAENLATLRPVRAFYVRSVDGFKVMTNSETGEPRYISEEGYELEGFELPKIEVDPVKFASDLESYEDLKRRLVLDTASFGAVSAIVAWQVFGVDRAVLVALGALAAVGYVLLLEKTADDVASGNSDTFTKLQGDVRFAIPVALVGAVALKNYVFHPETTGELNLMPKGDFAAAMLGFVAPSRLPLLYREVRSSLKADDILDMLPGSLGQGRQIMKGMGGSSAGAALNDVKADSKSTRILVVSGPKLLGKSTIVETIMREDSRLDKPVWCTTRPLKQVEKDAEEFMSIGQLKFEDIERNAGFLHTYRDETGESYGLRVEDVLAVAEKGKVCVLDADRPLVKSLMALPDVALIGVWVSLDSIEGIENRVRSALIKDGAQEGEELESNVRAMTRQAVSDIEFGVTSGVFDFTVINNSDVEESVETMRRAVEFATT